MILLSLALSLWGQEPRFVRTETGGAMLHAEAYARDAREPGDQARALLGREPSRIDRVEYPGQGHIIIMATAAPGASDPRRVLYADEGGREELMCLLSTRQPDGRDNRQEATRWCLSFLVTPQTEIPLPPLWPSSAPEG
ncbi:MAG TPA: hypothetical protein PLE81_06965 [Brevundimonas sp.]|jgi:hypothetical protein|uniref:hypothetical protein n=1 Tax=Brevundimonas sp. TaxID=1871086 RepID=UPI002CF94744|nr:hypothetical protein [Brevundimonas sp.]HRH20365.1 hypothetical protein [Brevundimonas sp.]